MTEEYVEISEGEFPYLCELCQKMYSEEGFKEHLRTHSREEILALKRLADLHATNPEGYEKLVWETLRLEYWAAKQRQKT